MPIEYIQFELYILIQDTLEKGSCRALCIVILTSKNAYNCVIIFLCLSWGTHMSIAVGTLQDLQCYCQDGNPLDMTL